MSGNAKLLFKKVTIHCNNQKLHFLHLLSQQTLILLYRCIFFLLTIDLISLLETVHLDPLFPHPHSIDLHFTIYYLFTCGSSLIFVFWLWYINIQFIFQLFTLKS